MQRNELINWANSLGFDPTTIVNDAKLEAHLKYLQNNGTAFAGTLATQTLTTSGTFSNNETITIGSVVYTMKTALSEAKATGVLTVSGNFAEGETVSVEGVTYTFRATPSNPYDVDLGADAATSLDNLKAAINDSGTEGTTYGTDTAAHPLVTATTNTDTAQTVEARALGTKANSYLTSENAANASWGGAVMSGGVEPVANEVLIGADAATSLDNIKSAVNDSGTEGTHYSTGTQAHPQVTADANGASTQVFTARDFAVTNASIATTETCANASFGAATLASGVSDVNAVNAVAVAGTGAGKNANV